MEVLGDVLGQSFPGFGGLGEVFIHTGGFVESMLGIVEAEAVGDFEVAGPVVEEDVGEGSLLFVTMSGLDGQCELEPTKEEKAQPT